VCEAQPASLRGHSQEGRRPPLAGDNQTPSKKYYWAVRTSTAENQSSAGRRAGRPCAGKQQRAPAPPRAAHRNCGAGGRAGCTASCLSKCAEDPHNKSEQRFQTSPQNAAYLSLLFLHAVEPAANEAQLAVRLRESRLVRSEAAGRQNEPKTSPLRILSPSCSAHGPNIA